MQTAAARLTAVNSATIVSGRWAAPPTAEPSAPVAWVTLTIVLITWARNAGGG